MKFLATALLAFVAATEAARSATTQKLRGTTIRDGPSARKLLEKAVKVDRHGQRVLSNNDFQVTSSYSLKFDTCVSLKTEPSTDQAIIFDDALIEYTTKGEIIPQKSYILFDVCETKYCDMYAKGDNMYMIDLSTYMYAFSEYYLQRQEAYCVACADSTDYCTYYQYQKKTNINYNEYDGASAYFAYQDAHGGRKLSRYNFELIDCDVCTKLDCLNELAETEEDTILTGTTNYVAGLTACQATKAYFLNTYQLYAGFMCNEDGSGVDIALFMDPACSVYNSIPAYKTFSSAADQILMYNATDLITYPFLNSINCNGDYAYLSMDEYRQQLQNYNYNGNSNNNNNDQVNQYCTALFEGGDGGQAVSLKDCNQDGVQDVEGANETVITYNDTDYPWYEFILSQEDMQSTDATCQIIDKMQGKYQTIYKWSGSGQNYDYGTGPQNSTKSYSAYSSYFSSNYNKMDSTLIAAIIVAVLVAFTAFCCILYSCCCTPNKCGKTLDRKKIGVNRERLVDPKTGILM